MKRLSLCLVAAGLAGAALAADRQLVEGIVVRVNDRILTVSDMRKRVAERIAETGAPVTPEQYPAMVQDAADDLCILERALELKVEVADQEVTETLAGLRKQNRIETDEQFEQTLRSMGMTLDQLRTRMREQILINRVLSREVGSLPITEEEVRQRYARDKASFSVPEHVHLEHIVLAVGPAPGDEERVLGRGARLVAAVRSGRDFATVLQEETASGGATGGDLGNLAVPDLRPEIRDAVAGLKPGEISDPFKSAAGVHVVRLIERTPAGFKPFAEVVDELRERELSDRYRAKMRGVVDDLKKRYIVETRPELFTPPS